VPAAGRIGSLVGAGISNYARTGEGLGKAFIDFCGKKEMAIGLLLCSVLFYIVAGLNGLLIMLLCSVSAYLSAKYFGKKIGGATGDTLGAVCELNQAIFLILWYIVHN
jgi:adenosylcobinamide-GDP ribazoletransferase